MKKIVSLAIVLLFSFSTFSQSKGFQLGLQLSPNLSWFKPVVNKVDNDGLKVGFSYGLTGDFNFSDNYAFSTGLFLLNSGGKLKYAVNHLNSDSLKGNTESNIRLKYIQIPITIKLRTNEIGYMKYYGQFGLGAAFNYGAVANESYRYSDHDNTDKDFNKGNVVFFRPSLIIGLGAEYNLSGNTSLVFGASFDNGFLNIFKKKYDADLNGNTFKLDEGKKS